MKQEKVTLLENDSVICELGGLILSSRSILGLFGQYTLPLIVGKPGLPPNVEKTLSISDAILFETPSDGVIEIRVLKIEASQSKLLVSQITPSRGFNVGFVDDDPSNAPFTQEEIHKIDLSLKVISSEIELRSDISPEQLDLINKKLDEINDASKRLGKKDWKNLVIGSLASAMVSAGIHTHIAKEIFASVNKSFDWLFQTAITLLPINH